MSKRAELFIVQREHRYGQYLFDACGIQLTPSIIHPNCLLHGIVPPDDLQAAQALFFKILTSINSSPIIEYRSEVDEMNLLLGNMRDEERIYMYMYLKGMLGE